MKTFRKPSRFNRILAASLAFLVALGPIATPTYAALTALADEPLNVKNSSKPNIVMTIDDSTSMLFDFLPDYVIDKYCRDGTGSMNSICGLAGASSDFSAFGYGKYTTPGYIFEQYNYPYTAFADKDATPVNFDVSGPGSGCDGAPKCSPGISPGASPGLPVYPTSALWSDQKNPAVNGNAPYNAYAYWKLWPAPVHSNALNHLYYNPMLTYEPPANADGTSFDSMNAANTISWTKVPADPWASPVRYADLTANVTVGQWCNSDWTMGNDTDGVAFADKLSYCRTNGAVGPAADGAVAADGDYTYPWVPSGITPFENLGYTDINNAAGGFNTIGMSIAFSKVNATTKALQAAWTGAQDSKYFYENDNVIWCDTTNTKWPQTGTPTPQVCNGWSATQSQTCSAQAQTCKAGGAQTCSAGSAQTCPGVAQTCINKTTIQSCNAPTAQTCNGVTAQTCNGFVAAKTCTQTIAAGTCNGFQSQTCATSPQGCVNVKPQSCTNLITTCVDSTVGCTQQYDPPGCNPANPEISCTLKTVCPQICTTAGTCTVSGAACTTANASTVCATIPGQCSINTGTSCTSGADCAPTGKCSVNANTCFSVGDCPSISGTCTNTGVSCTNDGNCAAVKRCGGVAGGAICTVDANCPAVNGKCSVQTGTACTSAANCPNTGTCSTTGAVCTTTCPAVGGTCNLTPAKACGTAADCLKAGKCSVDGVTPGATNCTANADCPKVNFTCSTTGTACVTAADCSKINRKCNLDASDCTATGVCPAVTKVCSIDTGTTCVSNANCPTKIGVCSLTAAACTATTAAQVAIQCPDQPHPGTCSITGATCSGAGAGNCTPVPTAGPTALCSDKLSDNSKSLFEDANNSALGEVCRHNNKAYTGANSISASRYNYPNAKYNTPVTGGTGANACTATPRSRSVPRHYWKTNVEWCDTAEGTAGDKWLGYGDNSGSCQSFKDSSHVYPRFYQFGAGPADSAYLDNNATPAFSRADLVSTNTYTHVYTSVDWQNSAGPKVTGTDTITRTYAQEMENYANWFAYYRTRIQAVKTVVSLSFLGKDPTTSKFNVDDKFRVGLHSLSAITGVATMFVPVNDFDATQKPLWATQLFGLSIRMAQDTPNLNAMARIGDYYKNGSSDQLPGTFLDPIVLACQKNWHMLFTDGLTSQPAVPTFTPGDTDDQTPSLATAPWINGILTPAANWPAPYREDASAPVANSASDYATYYWVNDLRPGMTNNVGTSAADKANWQHVNFAAISLGTEGKLAAGDQSGVESQLASGALSWPQPYPTVNRPDASGVDDLWHASVNSHGRFVNADSADEIKVGMGAILADIANTAGARAGAALQTVNLVGSGANAYRVTFEPGWGGTLSKVNINTSTFNEIPPSPWQVGGGKDVTAPIDSLYAQLAPTALAPSPWYTARKIVTLHTNGTAIPFLFDSLAATQQDTLAPGKPALGKQVLEYLRGSPENEGSATRNFRKRTSPLGDIVDASPKFVGPANLPFQEFADPGYGAFKAATASRAGRVYAASNDGMLHAFDDASGTETFAYVPRTLFRNSEDAGLASLTLKEGALPPFVHHFFVDSTPKIVDVDFGSKDWHTILVGGLGKGGHAYYALDVTAPSDILTETDAASKVLWEFTDTDLGYTYGPPIITKTAGFGGKWVVIVPSGYNNASGEGKIWILDAKTGAVLKTMSTGSGTAGSPAGLAQIAAFTQDYHNYMSDEVYGGDQYGNLWRFDLRNPDASLWTVGKLALLTDPSGTPQPVTTAPQIEIDIANGADRWVFVGTGRLLDESDLSDNQIQSFYAIRDGTQKVPSTIVSGSPVIRDDLVEVTDATGTSGITAHGWYDDLALHSRVVTPYQAVLSIVVYSATKPQTDPCLTGQSADVFVRNFAQGVSQLDPDQFTGSAADNCTAESCFSAGGAVDAQIVGVTADGSPTAHLSVLITLGGGDGTLSPGQLMPIPIKQPAFDYSHRLSWRILSE